MGQINHPFAPSAQQRAFFDWVAEGRGSAMLNAVAGAGKSTTVIEALPYWPRGSSIHLLAFNSPAGADLREKVEAIGKRVGHEWLDLGKVRAGTFHSAGFGAVCKKLGRSPREVDTDGGKLRKICDAWLGDDVNEMYGSFVCKLVSFAKGEGIGPLVPDVEERWHALITHHDMYLDDQDATETEAVRLARELLVRSNQASLAAHIDFDDQIYLPILWRLRLWQNDVVVVDEAQDTNPCRRALAKMMLRPGGRLVAVGDPDQGINGFTGASSDAMELIRREFNCVELSLSVSYRCSKAAVAAVRHLVSRIEAAPNAAAGERLFLSERDAVTRMTDADAVVCRNTAPLVSFAYGLISQGKPCTVLGREIGTGLVALIKKMRARTVDALLERLEAYRSREVAKHAAKGEEMKAEAVHDRVDCVLVVIENLGETERTVPALVRKIDGMFADQARGRLTLCTGHKSKGKEFANVFVLRPDLIPSRWARQDWQVQQERNLEYVMKTRTRGDLTDIVPERRPAGRGAAESLASVGLHAVDAGDGE